MATRQNHTQRHQTIEDKRDAGMLLLIADRVKHDGYPPTEAGVRRWLKRHSVRRWLASDEAALVMAHVNTAPPPMRRVHPGQNICRGEFPRVAKPVPVVVPARETPPEVADFIRRFRVAHSNDVDALDALIREVAA